MTFCWTTRATRWNQACRASGVSGWRKNKQKSSTGKPGNPPVQCTKTQISLCRKSQGLISFNNRRGCRAEGLCTNQWVHSGKHRGTQLETGRYEGEESRARKPVADLVQEGNGGMGRWKKEGDGNARQKWAHSKIITEDENGHGDHSEHVNKTAFYLRIFQKVMLSSQSKRSEVNPQLLQAFLILFFQLVSTQPCTQQESTLH